MEDVISSPHDLLNLRRVNKVFCDFAARVAFREIVVHTTEKSAQGFLELLVRPDITEHIRGVRIIEDPDFLKFETESDGDETYKQVGSRLRSACFMLHLIPTLESLVITFLPDEDSWVRPFTYRDELSRYQLLQWDVLEGLACNPNALPALQSLQIDNWFACTNELYDAAPFKRIISSLRDLRFLVQDTDYKSDDDNFDNDNFPTEDFWPQVIELRVLQPAMDLTSLSMESGVEFGSLVRLDLSSITYPCLTSLSLSNFVWDDVRVDPQAAVPQAENFIARHGKTLKKLEMHSCIICVPHDRPTPVRSWAAVWNRFADELTKLVDLVVVYNFDRRYAYYLPEYGFGSDSAYSIRGVEQDTPALEALVTMLKERMN